ncbi:MAG TPA: hypothetical protein VKK79_08950, partial [Candidatus Lokiarchaeia archaeon]|nr:hypothetical protein [Candidatus Lokiarchaeia archaeon]
NSSFVNYQANITGFQSDYFNIQVLNGSTVVGYTWVNATTIQIASPIDHVTFQSLNYIACITCPAEVYLGSTVTVSACLLGYGNVNLTIQQGTNVLYQSIVAATYEAFFSWPIGTATPAGPVTIQAYLTGINEIGFNASATIIKTEAALLVTGATVPALDNVSLSCHYYEFYTQNPITDAQVSYSVSNLNGQLAPLDSGNYGVTLNLNDFSLVPGTYSFSVQALKDGYRPLTQVVPLVVIARPVNIQLAQSQTTAYPGDKVQFSLEITDNLTDTYLQRPVNVQLSIQLAGQETGASQTPAASYIFTGVTNTGQWTWTVPGEIAIGQYDVTVTVSSPFFAGTQVFSRALTIVTPQIIWPYLIGLAIAALVGASIYVKREKVISRRSVKGIMILSPQGSSIAQKISPDFSRQNSLLISGAISGVITLMREITGKGLRRIKVEGGYIELVQKTGFWVVLLMHHNPAWVGGTISNLAKDVEAQYGAAIAEWNGQELNLPILELVKKWFGVEILEERSLGLPTGQNNT